MVDLHAKEFISLIHALLATELVVRDMSASLPSELAQNAAAEVERIAASLELRVTATTARNMLASSTDSAGLHRAVEQVFATLCLEVEDHKYFRPFDRYASYYEQAKLFGDAVFNAFPSARDDIFEAGTCLALERATACAMHLARALEVALSTLGRTLSISKQDNWGSCIRLIDNELKIRAKGGPSTDAQFYTEAAVSFDNLRRAFRNPTMHPEKNYSLIQAEEVLLVTKSLMNHLALRIHE